MELFRKMAARKGGGRWGFSWAWRRMREAIIMAPCESCGLVTACITWQTLSMEALALGRVSLMLEKSREMSR